jgi:hydroxyacylglutathione hydrolase
LKRVARGRQISPDALLELVERREAPVILDVRTPAEFAAGHVPGARNLPFTDILAGAVPDGVEPAEPVVIYCGHGPRAWMAGLALRWRGYQNLTYLRGHMAAWRRAGLREER